MPALPAVDVLRKLIVPPSLKMDTLLPAVALLEKTIVPGLSGGVSDSHEGLCGRRIVVMPTPLMVSVNSGLAVMV